MGWIDRALSSFGLTRANNLTALSTMSAGSDAWSAFTGAGVGNFPAMSEQGALSVPAIYASINLIAGAISTMPLVTYRTDPSAPRRIDSEFDWILNEQMCPRYSAPVGWEMLGQSLLLNGDAFALIQRQGAQVVGLEPLRWQRVTPYITPDGTRLVYTVAPDPAAITNDSTLKIVDQDDMIHIPGFGFDGRRGLSPLRHALRIAGNGAKNMQEYTTEFFANQARPDFFYTIEGTPSPEGLARMRAAADERHNAPGQRHRPMFLTEGMDVKTLSLPLEELQLLEARRFSVEDIARIYGVPPFMIGHTEKTTSWGSGVEAMGINFVKYALRQHLTKIQAELNRKLIRRAGRFFEFDTEDLEKADFKTRVEGFRILLGKAGERPAISPNEIRYRLRLPPVPGGDDMSVTGAQTAIDPEVETAPEPAAEKQPPATE
jgi:HK97 family phage portal protein